MTLPSTSDLVLDVESPRVVLQSIVVKEQFAATHCFRLVRQSDRAGQIGVALEPVPQRKLADISGVRSARIGGRQDFGYRPLYVPIGRQENGGGILGPGEIAANQRARARTAADSLNRKQP